MKNISEIKLQKIEIFKSFVFAFIPLLIVLFFLIKIDHEEILKIPNIIQIALFYGLVVYSVETLFLREATENNLLFEQRPCLVPRIRHMGGGNYRLKIWNVGRGTALDVSLKIIDPKKDYSGMLNGNVKYMPAGTDNSIKFSGSKIDEADPCRFDKTSLHNQSEGFKVIIKCRDASNNPMTLFQYKIKPEKGANWEIYTENIGRN